MTFHGRSLDDLPLAAYRTGADPDELDEASELEAAHPPMDARAAALSIVEPPFAASQGAAAERKGRRFALPRPRLPRPRLPRRNDTSQVAATPQTAEPSPVAAVPQGSSAPDRVSARPRAVGARPVAAAARPVAEAPRMVSVYPDPHAPRVVSVTPEGAEPRLARLPLPTLSGVLTRPRMIAGGVAVALIAVVVVAFGGGLTSGGFAQGPTASPTQAVVAPQPGVVSLTLSGATTGSYSLNGTTGLGRPPDGQLSSTWADSLGTSLTLTGRASQGTRPTGSDLELRLTMVVDGSPVTFTSETGECVVGMAVEPTTVRGSIVCDELASEDGEVVVELTGSYRT